MTEKFTFFWRGPFSQWKISPFIVYGTLYNCAEQFMMASKSRLFHDDDTLKKIMDEKDPSTQKKLGRQVKNFNQKIWNIVARPIVYRGNIAKFTQNPELCQKLVATAGTTLVEASPVDEIWGIKLSADDPRAQSRSTWLGTNWLGQELTHVRDDIMDGLIGECRYCENVSTCNKFSELQKIKDVLIDVKDCLAFNDILLKLC